MGIKGDPEAHEPAFPPFISTKKGMGGLEKEKYYLKFNKDQVFINLIASEGHFRNFKDLKSDEAGFLNCIVKLA